MAGRLLAESGHGSNQAQAACETAESEAEAGRILKLFNVVLPGLPRRSWHGSLIDRRRILLDRYLPATKQYARLVPNFDIDSFVVRVERWARHDRFSRPPANLGPVFEAIQDRPMQGFSCIGAQCHSPFDLNFHRLRRPVSFLVILALCNSKLRAS